MKRRHTPSRDHRNALDPAQNEPIQCGFRATSNQRKGTQSGRSMENLIDTSGDFAGSQGEGDGVAKDLGVTATFSGVDPEAHALVRRGRRAAHFVLMLVVTLTVVAALVPVRFIAQAWSEDDIFQCQASAFVSEAASAGTKAQAGAMSECLAHRRNKRWGPWGAFGNANDGSRYTAADD